MKKCSSEMHQFELADPVYVLLPLKIVANTYVYSITHRETLVALSALFMRNKANEA